MLAHILGRLPCPIRKKTPRKIGNSMLAQYQYRMKIQTAKNYCRIISCATKNCKNQHKLANCNAIRIYHNGKIVAEASTALRRQNKLAPQSHHTLRNNKGKITFRLHHKEVYRLSGVCGMRIRDAHISSICNQALSC